MPATLLLADDSITIQRVIELTFADEQVRVITAGDGQLAIQRIDAEHPDIVLADVGMPKVDGYGVAAYVKQTPALRHIPVLLLTGAFEPIDEAKARATGCDGILVKPFEPQMLITRVRELLDGQLSAALWPAELPRVEQPAAPAAAGVTAAAPAPPVAPTPALVVTQPPAPPAPAPARAVEPGVAEPTSAAPAPAAPSFPALPQEILRPASRNPVPVPQRPREAPRDLPPPVDAFESELDMLDVALSRLEPTATPRELDAATASDFARDIESLRGEPGDVTGTGEAGPTAAGPVAARPMFGDWDLPAARASQPGPDVPPAAAIHRHEPVDLVPEELPADRGVSAPAAASPAAPAPVPPVSPAPSPAAPEPPARPVSRPSLANAFTALLAAERAQPPARALTSSATLSEAAIEDVVKRVLERMTNEAVHKVVLNAAERIIREEIARLKAPVTPPDRSGQ